MAGIPWGPILEALGAIASIASNPEAVEQMTKTAKMAADAVSAGVKAAEAAAEAVAPVTQRVAYVGTAAADAAGKTASGVFEKGGRVAGAAVGAVKDRRESREQAKALLEARRQILASASVSVSAERFQSDWEKASAENLLLPLKSAGYYVIVVYKGKPGKNDWGKYADVYVGRSQNMGASVHDHLSGDANADVYADMKYGKYVHVFAFPDFDEEVDKSETLSSFVFALGAEKSYNKRVIEKVSMASPQFEVLVDANSADQIAVSIKEAFDDVRVVERELCGNNVAKIRLAGPSTTISVVE